MARRETENLTQALEELRSDKVTERQQAVLAIRATFDRDSAVLYFDKKGDGKSWLALYQALFEAFAKELKACVSKTGVLSTQTTGRGTSAVRRLGDVASLIRWLTERSIDRLNSRVLKSLLTHLTHGIVYRGELLVPVALDYAKTIKSILSYKPHLYAIKDTMWHDLVALAFNSVVGRPPKRRLADHLDPVDDGMDVDSDMGGDDAESSAESDRVGEAGPSTSRLKRSRRDSQTPKLPRRDGPSTVPSTSQPVSLEQIEFISILAILLRSSTAPILFNIDETDEIERNDRDPHAFPRLLLNYFSRFLHIYPGDTSLHQDFLVALSATLSHLALNCRQIVSPFANKCWHHLVSMWGRKDRRMKEDLVVVLRLLFPLLTVEPLEGEPSADTADAVATLWSALDGESQTRWGIHGLSLDSIQLHLSDSDVCESSRRAFVANTFRYGWHFNEEQALSWGILELHADCAEKLYLRSESTYSSATPSRKRPRLENPISSLLSSVRSQASQHIRTYHLQVLLFYTDRHWDTLHDQLRRDVIATLIPFVSFEDASIQSWAFLCLAAIAHAEYSSPTGSSTNSSSNLTSIWDPIWTHAMRRANVPAVSRAACHAAHVLLIHSKRLLSSQRVLLEIESFAKDLDVQGPAYPCDSVCDFLVLCLRIANQDVRLYRMQMEEKVLSWLTESWRICGDRRTSMPLSTVTDIHALLEGIVGSARRVRLQCGNVLPHCAIVEAMVEETRTAVIRNFQLYSRLPPYLPRRDSRSGDARSSVFTPTDDSVTSGSFSYGDSTDLAPPRGRERRLSAFLLKSLEETLLALSERDDGHVFPTAETIRCSLDLAVTALCYEASLLLNGTQSNRRVIQAACKLFSAITPLLTDQRWKAEERRLILDGLDPLTRADDTVMEKEGWQAMVPPGERTGIKTQVLRKLVAAAQSTRHNNTLRRDLQRSVFRSADVQDTFVMLLKQLLVVLRLAVGQKIDSDSKGKVPTEDTDGFGPVRTATSATNPATRIAQKDADHSRHVVDACMTALAAVPILQSSSGEPTRNRDLTDLVMASTADEFLALGPAYCEQIGRKTLFLSTLNLESLLDKISDICLPYAHKHSDETLLLVIRILDTTSHLWLQSSIASESSGEQARLCCWGLVKRLKSRNQRSWRVLDAIIRFLDAYLIKDPNQTIWAMHIETENDPLPEDLPAAVIPTFGSDPDIRIRFRVATTSPRLFAVGRLAGREPTTVYHDIRDNLSARQDDYESIITRLLCLGNMMIADASIRRGAYWHLLEITFYSGMYLHHLKAILTGVVERMGIESLAVLFDCYSSQFAFSIRRNSIDLFKISPDLLGYRDRRECAEATFHAFTPTNLLAAGNAEEVRYGQELYVRHCQAIQKSEQAGIEECFPFLVAYEIVFWLCEVDDEKRQAELDLKLREKTRYSKSDATFPERLKRNADGIVIAMLKSLGDQDVSPNGPIFKAMESLGSEGALGTFRAITRYRALDTYETHEPNLPSYDTSVVLLAIEWFGKRIKDAESPAVTYHVLQQLSADIESTPLVNEQYRLLNAACLWIACHHDHFKDESLLRTLIRRAVTMLAQVDLVHGAQSLLEWCFSLYKGSTTKADYRLADVLIRVSSIAHTYSQSNEGASVAKLGMDLLAWAEKQADILCRSKHLKKQVVRSLAAWPRELPISLQSACDEVKLSDLTSVLVDHGVSTNKFRLVRRIHDLASQRDSDERFSTSDFWRLKACIPPEPYLVDSDINAFTSLLMLHCGHVDSIGSDHLGPETVRTIHSRAAERPNKDKEYPPRVDVQVARVAIVISLLTMPDTSPAHQLHVAYRTLRTLMSVPSSESYIGSNYTGDIRRELEYLQAFAEPFPKGTLLELRSELMGETMVHLAKDFHTWIARVSIIISQVLGARDSFFSPLAPILQSDHDFADQLLPVLVHSLLQIEHDEIALDSPGSARNVLSEYFTAVLSYEDTDIAIYRAVINVVLHLRSFRPATEIGDPLAHDHWLSVDFALLSRCAIQCSAYTTALLFLELASEYGASPSAGTTTEDILFEIFSHIDEPDGFYGIHTDDLRNFFVKRLRHENQWDKAFRFHGAVVESGAAVPSDSDGIVQALYAFGFNQLALNTMQNLSPDSNTTTESSTLAYNLGWRAETWDLPENLGNNHSGAALYLALRAVYRERSPHVVDTIVRRAFIEEMNRLRDLGIENFTEIRQVTQNLMCLNQVRQWRSHEVQQKLQSRHVDVTDWTRFTHLDTDFDFGNIEAIMATRLSLIRSVRQKEQRDQIGDLSSPFSDSLVSLEKACLLCLSERARDVHQAQIALNSVIRAQSLDRPPSLDVAQEFARVLWLMKEPKLAVKSLGALTSWITSLQSNDTSERLQYAALLAQLGTWSAEASLKKPSQIVTECFGPAAKLIMDAEIVSSLDVDHAGGTVFHQYAIFAERQYRTVSKSSDALRWKLYVDRKREEIKQRAYQMKRMQSMNYNSKELRSLGHEQKRAETILQQDIQRSQEHFGQRASFLALAIEMYSRCLALSDKYDEDSPIRLCSLWLADFDNDKPTYGSALDLVPSRKFVFLAHQLTARLSMSDAPPSPNQGILQRVIHRMGRDHPYHSLFPLYCLRIDRVASQATGSSRRQSDRHASPAPSQLDRAAAVADVFDKLRCDSQAGARVIAVEHVCNASLEWAKYPIRHLQPKNDKIAAPLLVPEKLLIRRLKDVPVPVITSATPIDATAEYRDCVWISHYETHYSTAGGVNLPKIMKCVGSDGRSYKQLFKGEGDDDLRQDAVMEQVFDLVNVVLRHDRDTQKRKLSVRGYKVIPLAAQAGVLEFVENTTPLQNWLRPAHMRYRPRNMTTEQFMKAFSVKNKEWRENPQEVISQFVRLRERFGPVMRHYFTEKHKTPMAWFAMRLHYARSVATTSIVGHILGLGDRHTSNILMDNRTGEVVHIDLGIAFEQGKMLPQPERVPFRLTADMVDGLGISGTQGVFQRCAEETLRVLRDGSETILTVLEVFKYDPLHSWTASEFKIKRAQAGLSDDSTAQLTGEAFRFAVGIDMASGASDEAADRALSTVARKLDKTLSVEYTVNELITEASDPANLGLMYSGWSPHY